MIDWMEYAWEGFARSSDPCRAREVADALRAHAITVLDDESRSVKVKNHSIDLVGIPNARVESARSKQLLAGLAPERPSIVLTHDPMWFANVPRGPHLTLAGHTHGGQISLPGVGLLKNASKAPLRWTHGLIRERGQYLYVTSGIGTSGVPLRWRVPPEFVVLDVIGPPVAAISTVGAATGCLSASTA